MWLIRSYHDLAFERRRESRDLYSETLRVLSVYQQDRTQAAYLLIINGLVWDAEIVIRTLYEAFAKAALLSTAPSERQENLLNEFWETLPAIYDRQAALKAKIAESLAKHHGKRDDARVFAFLRNPKRFKVDPVADKRTRNEIERRWSFSGILEALKRGSLGHERLSWIEALAHMYGVSSHLVHADPKAFDLMEDRSLRGDDLLPLEVGHICRMLSDMVSLTSFSLYLTERSWGGVQVMPAPLKQALDELTAVTAEHQTQFAQSQEEFYAKSND